MESEERQRQIERNLLLPPVKRRAVVKHVSRACLNCRKRHFKCGGELPICDKCSKSGAICTYVESKRGGSRKRKVKEEVPDIESVPSRITDDYKLPCQIKCGAGGCPQTKTTQQPCECPEKKVLKFSNNVEENDFGLGIHNYANLFKLDVAEQEDILTSFYANFHGAHPFVAPRDQIYTLFEDELIRSELLHVMKVIADGMGGQYAHNIPLVGDRLVQCVNIIKQNKYNDIISLQALLLISMVGHILALHNFSQNIRQYCIQRIEDLGINIIDSPVQSPLAVYRSPRLQHIPRDVLDDCGRRLFYELIFFDVITGSADGKTLTNLASIRTEINYPSFPPADIFDYKGRAEAALLVNKAIKLNLAIINRQPLDKHLKLLQISLSTMQMKMANPSAYGLPTLISRDGRVNDGVHQSIILFNYAKIFVHRPFSYLWKINAPQVPKCMGGGDDLRPQATALQEDQAAVETQKTIDAADSIIKGLMDTNAAHVLKRTPMIACALALSSLVHLSAYIWIDACLKQAPRLLELTLFSEDDLAIIADYIQLSISAIYPVTKRWALSGRLARHIRDSVAKLRPDLYAKMAAFLPSLEEKDETPVPEPEPEPEHKNSITVLLNTEPFGDQKDTGCDWIDKALMDYFDQ